MLSKLVETCAGSWKFTDQEQLILEFDDPITDPKFSFVVHFNYTLKQGLSGFYRSNYTSKSSSLLSDSTYANRHGLTLDHIGLVLS